MRDGNVVQIGLFGSPKSEPLESLCFPGMTKRQSGISVEARGTCTWILEHASYLTWQHHTNSLLWLKGHPGVGKSTLMKYLVNLETERQRTTPGLVVISFFCYGQGTELQKSKTGVLRSLLYHLLLRVPALQTAFECHFKEREKQNGPYDAAWTWSEVDLDTLAKEYCLKASAESTVHFFVDALDECGEMAARDLLRLFKYVTTASHTGSSVRGALKICVSSRHHPLENLQHDLSVHVEEGNSGDVLKFAAEKLSLEIKDKTWVQKLSSLVAARASSMFLWAALAINRILDLFRDGRGLSSLKAGIEKTPKELHKLYLEIMHRIKDDHQILFRRLLAWICVAKRQLTEVAN